MERGDRLIQEILRKRNEEYFEIYFIGRVNERKEKKKCFPIIV